MTIHVGDRIPEVTLKRIREGIETLDTHSLFDARKVVLFAVPGAFTPTCSARHLPGYVEKFEAFRQRGIDVYCMAVNDPFVMKAWAADQKVPDGLLMLSDGNAELTRALGLELDASASGMGMRSRRFALYVFWSGNVILATPTYGESFSGHSTVASSIGILIGSVNSCTRNSYPALLVRKNEATMSRNASLPAPAGTCAVAGPDE